MKILRGGHAFLGDLLVTTDHLVVTIITGFKRSNNEQIKQNPQCLLCLVSHPLQENPHNPHNGYQ